LGLVLWTFGGPFGGEKEAHERRETGWKRERLYSLVAAAWGLERQAERDCGGGGAVAADNEPELREEKSSRDTGGRYSPQREAEFACSLAPDGVL